MRQINNIRLPRPFNNLSKEELWSISLDQTNSLRSIRQMEIGSSLDGENWNGDWLSPMGIDLQINGGLGIAFNDLHLEQLPKMYELLDQLWSDGVEAICPTIITSSITSFRNSLRIINIAREKNKEKSCKLLGAHLEGPFL